jgi:hypothetical protein
MKIKYVGSSGVRIIGVFEWNAQNGFVQDVPNELAASLLTYPRPDFELAEGEDAAAAEKAVEEVVAGIKPAKSKK